MLTIKTILFPTDFSACAEHAFTEARYLAQSYKAILHVLNIDVSNTSDPDNPMRYLDDLDTDSPFGQLAQNQRHDLPGGKDQTVVYTLDSDVSATRGILAYAKEHDTDLIVMGTHGRHGVDRLLLGSVAEEVVRSASCPVLTIGASTEGMERKPIQRILVPIDFSDFSSLALTYAKELASTYEAHLDLLHVIVEGSQPGAYGIGPTYGATQEVKHIYDDALNEVATKSLGATVPIETHLLIGRAPHDIIDFAVHHESDLIVIATHGRTGLKRLLMGSVAESVVRDAPCPVFTVKSFGKSLVPPLPAQVPPSEVSPQ